MGVIRVLNRFSNQEACVAHMEQVRFKDGPYCPRCGAVGECARKQERDYTGRWNCHACKSTFNVLTGTIFQSTHIPLQKWFVAIEVMMNAKKSLSSPELGRQVELTQQTALYVQQRIRSEMATKQGKVLLRGIIEADETFVGGRPRKSNARSDNDQHNPRRQRDKEDGRNRGG